MTSDLPDDDAMGRSIGALLGLACGDAVGTALEFATPGTFEPIVDMVGGGPFGLEPGQWTDDTSMAMCLAESLLDRGELDPEDNLRRWIMWRDEGYWSSTGSCFDIGATTSRQLARYEREGTAIDDEVDEEVAANGSLMRLAPVPVRWSSDAALASRRAGESSRTTHPARRPVDACRLAGWIIAELIHGTDWSDLPFGDVPIDDLHPSVASAADATWRGRPEGAVRGTGYCVDALEAALWAVDGANDFADAVLRAANLGDDADTTAAIAGQFAGARWGASRVPHHWRSMVTAAPRIVEIACGLHRAGLPDRQAVPWLHDGLHHAWRVDDSVLAGEHPGQADAAATRNRIDLLLDAGIRTFVDLTTDADALADYRPAVAAASRARRLETTCLHHPIPDFDVTTRDGYLTILGDIDAARSRGGVYVHCWGGIGRTGTVIGCMLGAGGSSADAVHAELARLRVGTRSGHRRAPEMPSQIAMIDSFCD